LNVVPQVHILYAEADFDHPVADPLKFLGCLGLHNLSDVLRDAMDEVLLRDHQDLNDGLSRYRVNAGLISEAEELICRPLVPSYDSNLEGVQGLRKEAGVADHSPLL
jgi:hypothetical protein